LENFEETLPLFFLNSFQSSSTSYVENTTEAKLPLLKSQAYSLKVKLLYSLMPAVLRNLFLEAREVGGEGGGMCRGRNSPNHVCTYE
jgi:hypothetical protein